MRVEVVYALPERQWCEVVELPEGAALAAALSAVADRPGFRSLDLGAMPVGVWGRVATDRSTPLADGDRVELYRPLRVDPMVARREREAAAVLKSRAPP